MAITHHKHLALIRASTDKEFLKDLAKLDAAEYQIVRGGVEIRYQGKGIVALMTKPTPEAAVFAAETDPEFTAQTTLPDDPAFT